MLKMGRNIKRFKKNIRLFSKSFLPSYIYNIIIYILIKNKFLNNYSKNKLQNNKYKNINNIKEYKISSQNNEDGIINSLILNLKRKNNFFFEVGIDYYEFNSLQLIKNGWSGLVIDFDEEKIENLKIIKDKLHLKKIKILKEKISPQNINSIYKKNFNCMIDFFSLDIDSVDFYVLKNMRFTPKIICLEFNPFITEFGSIVVKYKNNNFDNSNYAYGASINAYVKLLKKKGYKLVALDSSNVNAFFINPKEFKNKFKEIDILNNENLKKFIKKNKKTINKIQINRYIKY
jgi:hypothetical protein